MAKLSPEERARLLPPELEPMDSLSVPEPSVGALIEVGNGRHAAVIYGQQTGTLTVEVPANENASTTLLDFILEVPIDVSSIRWIKPDLFRATQDQIS